MSKYPINSSTIDAKYSEQKVDAYKGNPCIEALPTFVDSKDIFIK